MPGGMIFEYKCSQGHFTETWFPPGTAYDKHSTILCPKCTERGEIEDAFIIFAFPENERKK